jgi:hypothetical protein
LASNRFAADATGPIGLVLPLITGVVHYTCAVYFGESVSIPQASLDVMSSVALYSSCNPDFLSCVRSATSRPPLREGTVCIRALGPNGNNKES